MVDRVRLPRCGGLWVVRLEALALVLGADIIRQYLVSVVIDLRCTFTLSFVRYIVEP
jgi:hypothetical protein